MTWDPATYKHQELTQVILGVFYEVYNELGCGFLESVHQEATLIALRQKGAMVEGQSPLPVWFRGERSGDFRADLIVGNAVIVGLTAGRDQEPIHDAQLLNYLRASELEVGLLLNFGPAPKIKRLFANEKKKNLRLSA
jgi:GxxExxY protein